MCISPGEKMEIETEWRIIFRFKLEGGLKWISWMSIADHGQRVQQQFHHILLGVTRSS